MINQLNADRYSYNRIVGRWNREMRKFEHENLVCYRASTCMVGLCLIIPSTILIFSTMTRCIMMNQANLREIIIGYICVGGMFSIFICMMVASYKADKELKNITT